MRAAGRGAQGASTSPKLGVAVASGATCERTNKLSTEKMLHHRRHPLIHFLLAPFPVIFMNSVVFVLLE